MFYSNDFTITRFCFPVAIHAPIPWSWHSFYYFSILTSSPCPCGLLVFLVKSLRIRVTYPNECPSVNLPVALTMSLLGRNSVTEDHFVLLCGRCPSEVDLGVRNSDESDLVPEEANPGAVGFVSQSAGGRRTYRGPRTRWPRSMSSLSTRCSRDFD
jgi:hypothetical protein